ncbi:glycosyltransferase family 15 protein [Conidiobolus coronatus NRRL 28638]|uniref:Glycosyltransferase family 15 protein n=1 Tax=Conidiobolus coronatus (strain ATCC 28846 / CBS 209.66 / NRRL 28638) TaxID=796925 RepID=A0A137PB03_CONC2|nr:glycosyltransferase family 15 protein [Conidiobolus coronatus NRRL 28638]|eukprot:KXN72200.1 glycosyltransferase family 15 protein [Conidiobolus coronatus NRRL 28638]
MSSSNSINLKRGGIIIAIIGAIWVLGYLLIKSETPISNNLSEGKKASLKGTIPNSQQAPDHELVPKSDKLDQIVSYEEIKAKSELQKQQNNGKVNAAFVVLVRNKELNDWLNSMRELEDRFNRNYNYPYVFLNEQNFTIEFKESVKAHTKAEVKFGTIPQEHWSIPNWIDKQKAKDTWKNAGYIYGDSESYRHMCRFESGFFFRHPLLAEYDYYWRVEPDVHFTCDINYDPFKFMVDNDKVYGFTITYRENMATIPTLWKTVTEYMKKEEVAKTIPKYNAIKFLREKEGDDYNSCHFWSNFEIGNLNVFRSKLYLDFFDHLDKSGGFFYERWGDAPVHSIFVSIFLPKSQLHFFKDIGYKHADDQHCPEGLDYLKNNCHCDQNDNWDRKGNSCTGEWNRAIMD